MLRRLRVTQKLTSLGLLALLIAGLPTVLYLGQTAPIIATAEREDSGIAPLRALQEVVRLTPQRRGLSAGMPGGNATLEVRRPETRDALNRQLAGACKLRLDQWAERKRR